MSQHYTKNTAAVMHYCPTCNRFTMHRTDYKRLGTCTEHEAPAFSQKQIDEQEKRERENNQPGLF
jgi:hypothetical protein